MSIYLLGHGSVPFGRTFFNTALDELLAKAGEGRPHRVTLYLTDGLALDVCEILELGSDYVTVHALRSAEEPCDPTVHLVPYGLIYRVEVAPKAGDDRRFGFAKSARRLASP